MQPRRRMVIEIDVLVELAPIETFMRSTAHVFGIVEELGNIGDSTDQRQKFRIAHQAVEACVCRTEAGKIGDDGFAPQLSPLVCGALEIEGWELLQQLP